MAILQGFPPSNTISPSVRIAEKDMSFVTSQQTYSTAGLVGFASKGPMNSPTLIKSVAQLNTVFGYPHPDVSDPYLIYAASQFLLVANNLFVLRVGNTDPVSDGQATVAEVDVPAAGSLVDIFSATAGPYSFAGQHDGVPHDYFFRWRLNGILTPKTLVVLNDAHRTGVQFDGTPAADQPYATQDLVNELNSQLDLIQDGIIFYDHVVGGNHFLGVKTTFAYGSNASLEFVSVQDSMVGGPLVADDGTNVTGLGIGMTPASTTGAADRFPNNGYQTPGTYDFTGMTGLNLQVVIDGTDNVLSDQMVQTLDLSALEGGSHNIGAVVDAVNAAIADNPGGFVASATGNNLTLTTLHTGGDARLLVKSSSSTNGVFGFDNVTAKGLSPVMVVGDAGIEQAGIVEGGPNIAGDLTFTIQADSPGIDGNKTAVVINNDPRTGTFSMMVYNNGQNVESWGNLTKDPSSSFYVETFLALVSDWVKVIDNPANRASPANSPASGFLLSGGTDGIPSDPDDQDTLLIGSPLSYSGIYAFSEPENTNIDLLAVPGHSSTAVVLAMLDVCQNHRLDCLAIIDPPFGLTVNEIVAWQNGTHPLNQTRFDSDFGALYWPWVKMTDTWNRVDVWVPPSGAVMATYARSDFLGGPWFAPAGINRGRVPGITDVFSRPTQVERDQMYGNRNAINPIVQFTDVEGFVIWGQKTLQRTPTALDRVNVRRLMFVCEKQIRSAARNLLFDPNDSKFQTAFTLLAEKVLREVRAGRGIHDYKILADETLNTPDVVAKNEFRARIGIQPTYAAEFMYLEFSIHKQGDFSSVGADSFA